MHSIAGGRKQVLERTMQELVDATVVHIVGLCVIHRKGEEDLVPCVTSHYL